jgi:hypothetical protein
VPPTPGRFIATSTNDGDSFSGTLPMDQGYAASFARRGDEIASLPVRSSEWCQGTLVSNQSCFLVCPSHQITMFHGQVALSKSA